MKFLVIRRDNIGDLVVTTPVFCALRERFPQARIEALVNTYNAPVLANHPDVDAVHTYTKDKHLAPGQSRVANWLSRASLIVRLRRARFDTVLLAAPGYRPRELGLARALAPGRIASFVPRGQRIAGVDLPVDFPGSPEDHHLEDTFRILGPLGIAGPPPRPRLGYRVAPREPGTPLRVAIHVSARRPSQRWPEERFVELMRTLHGQARMRFLLFWAPGSERDPRHPGDDEKAARILKAAGDVPVEAVTTAHLGQLIEGVARSDALIAGDGGVVHIASALGLPVTCLYGVTEPREWGPWNPLQRVVRPDSRDVIDATVAQVREAFLGLAAQARLLD